MIVILIFLQRYGQLMNCDIVYIWYSASHVDVKN